MKLPVLAEKLADKAIMSGAIAEDERELYLYAYQALIAQAMSWTSLILIGAMFHSFWGALIYMIFFIPLRTFAGGFHQNNYMRCYLTSLIIFLLVVVVVAYAAEAIPMWAACVLFAASVFTIFQLAPVADPNKPLDQHEKTKYKKMTQMILAIETAAVVLSVIINIPMRLLLLAMAAPLTVAILLLLGQKEENDKC